MSPHSHRVGSNGLVPRVMRGQERRLGILAVRAGWSVTMGSGGHIHWRNPEGHLVVVTSATPKHDSVKKIRADLRRNGLEC